jgi:YD repeat-containing protein
VFVLLIGFIVRYATLTSFAQTGNPSAYIYDDKGQVRAVVAQTGEATVYDYDAAGNFVGIRRLNSDAFEVLTFSPREGVVGTRVRIYGIGFSAGITSVAFNGTAATVVSSDSISVTATVPNGATTGPITVVSPRGTRTTAIPFTVRGIAIQPAAVNLPSGFSQQFTANIVGLPSANIIWSVNGLNNGNNEVGTISNTGLYVAPFVLGLLPRQFAVRATSADSPGDFAEAVVTVQPFDATVTPSLFTQPHGAGLRGLSPATVAATTNIRWQKTLPRGIGHGSITFSNNGEFLYFKTAGGSHQGIVYKVRASDGTTVWETNPATIGFGSASNSGITIDETAGRVYTSGRSDSLPAGGSIVTALNINDGSVIWSRKVIDLNANIGDVGDSIMLLSPDRTRIYTRDNRSPNSIIALDAANGNLIWRQQITTGGTGLVYFTVGPVWTDPASGKPRIAYINNLTTNSVGVIQDDGVTASLAWSRNIALGLNYKWWGNAMANGNDTQLYITSFSDAGNPVVTALNAANGATVWQIFSSTNGMNQYANPAIGVDGTIYSPGRMTGSVGGLTAIRPNGTIKWQIRPTGSLELTSWAVATAGGVVYVSDQASNLLYAIKDNTNNATVLWQFQLTGSVGTGVTSPSVGPDGTVYVATGSTDTGSRILYALRP